MRHSQSAPRWVLIVWVALAAGLVAGLGLWIVHGVLRGVPGPVVAGVYLNGAGDVAVVAVYMVSATALATVSAVMVSRVPSNRIGWILEAVAVWMVAMAGSRGVDPQLLLRARTDCLDRYPPNKPGP